jgi:acylphosphatase
MLQRVKIIVRGAVQGVFFRESTADYAGEHGLGGSVRNSDDGCVEIIAEADEKEIIDLLEWLKRGPGRSRVEKVEVVGAKKIDDKTSKFAIIR